MLQWEGPKTQVLISCHGTLLPGNGRPLSLCHIKILEGGLEYYLFFWRMLLRYALQGLLPGHCNNFAEAYDKYWIMYYEFCECAHIIHPLFISKIIRYMDIPVISRLYFTGAFLTTAGCALDIISPFSLYFNFDLIFHQGQFWRLITTYLFFGMFSIDFLFHMYFLVSCLITLWIAKYGKLMLLL